MIREIIRIFTEFIYGLILLGYFFLFCAFYLFPSNKTQVFISWGICLILLLLIRFRNSKDAKALVFILQFPWILILGNNIIHNLEDSAEVRFSWERGTKLVYSGIWNRIDVVKGWHYAGSCLLCPGNSDSSPRYVSTKPHHFTADLNGDGLNDDAWILIKNHRTFRDSSYTFSTSEYEEFPRHIYGDSGLFVFFNQKEGPPNIVRVDSKYVDVTRTNYIFEIPRETEYSGIEIMYQWGGLRGIYWDKKTSSFVEAYRYVPE